MIKYYIEKEIEAKNVKDAIKREKEGIIFKVIEAAENDTKNIQQNTSAIGFDAGDN